MNIQEAAAKSLRIEQVLGPFPQWTAQPVGERNAESHLRSLDKLPRHIAIEHPAQQPFGFAVAHREAAAAAVQANSTTRWSSKGGRTSSDTAIDARSTFCKMSSGKYVAVSNSCMRSRALFRLQFGHPSATTIGCSARPWVSAAGIRTLADQAQINRIALQQHDLGELLELVCRLRRTQLPRQQFAPICRPQTSESAFSRAAAPRRNGSGNRASRAKGRPPEHSDYSRRTVRRRRRRTKPR